MTAPTIGSGVRDTRHATCDTLPNAGRCPSNDDPMTGDPDTADDTDNNGVEIDCMNHRNNGGEKMPTVHTLPVVAVASKGYVWVAATTPASSTCTSSTAAVNAIVAYFKQMITTTGTYGLCHNSAGGVASTFVVSGSCIGGCREKQVWLAPPCLATC